MKIILKTELSHRQAPGYRLFLAFPITELWHHQQLPKGNFCVIIAAKSALMIPSGFPTNIFVAKAAKWCTRF